MIEYSKLLIENGVHFLAVGTTEEALKLREAGIEEDILMLSGTAVKDDLQKLIENKIIITMGSVHSGVLIKEIAEELEIPVRLHVKVDTGFGRYGFLYDDIPPLINLLGEVFPSAEVDIAVEGIYSHFSVAYYKNNKWTIQQFDRFTNIINELEAHNINIEMKHMCNSPAFLNYPNMHLNASRIGSAFLGRVDAPNEIGLKKIGEFRTNITEIKTVPKGYNIGYLNSYKTKRETTVAIVQFGNFEGYNMGNRQDMFRFVDNLRNLVHSVKNLLKKRALQVNVKGKTCNVIGKVRNVSYCNRYNRL